MVVCGFALAMNAALSSAAYAQDADTRHSVQPRTTQTSRMAQLSTDSIPTEGKWGSCTWKMGPDGQMRIATDGDCVVTKKDEAFLKSYDEQALTIKSQIKAANVEHTILFESGSSFAHMFDQAHQMTSFTGMGKFQLQDPKSTAYLSYMFAGTKVDSVDFDQFRPSNNVITDFMFAATTVKHLNLSQMSPQMVGWLLTADGMFKDSTTLRTVQWPHEEATQLRSTAEMYSNDTALESVSMPMQTMRLSSTRSMFEGCTNLQTLDLSDFIASDVGNAIKMFSGCTKLRHLDISNLVITKHWSYTMADNMFDQTNIADIAIDVNMAIMLDHLHNDKNQPAAYPGSDQTLWYEGQTPTNTDGKTWTEWFGSNRANHDLVYRLHQ
ncbi:leucine-rich repeat domain-containing protein [Bifidobacterium dolichotidis]|nr:leucine-rich repeat domain-containing protein [Bifidobacterium dolichotidis]